MKLDYSIFKPNQHISKATMSYVVAFQIGLVLIIWMLNPISVIPTPKDVIDSFFHALV